jgi:hypothetical protein
MNWFQTYTRIAFQLHAALEAMGEMYLVDTYYGPQEWRTDTPPTDLRVTLSEIETLRDALPTVTASEQRRDYLMVHLRALETVCRYLTGEPMTLLETTGHFLDIVPVPVPETVLEEHRRMLEEALGGTGTLAERYARFDRRLVIQPKDDEHLQTLYRRALAEAQHRTRAILPLSEEEQVEIQVIRGVRYGAANWYLGNGSSRMELNGERPVTLLRLLMLACHEGYPGHHTESLLKERFLYREQGLTEQSLFFNGPSVVIAEGIATLAAGMIFPPDEAAAWLQAEYKALGQPLEGVDLPLLMHAFWAVDPDALGTNGLLMFEEGATFDDVLAKALRYTLNSEAEVRRMVAQLQEATLLQKVYQFSYYHGRHLMEPLLQGENRLEMWRTFLTEQLTPGGLREWKGA